MEIRAVSIHSIFFQKGMTLIELIMVIVILGVLSLSSLQFIAYNMQNYTINRDYLQLNEQGFLALWRIKKILHRALPESIRVSNDKRCLEYLPLIHEIVLPVYALNERNLEKVLLTKNTSSYNSDYLLLSGVVASTKTFHPYHANGLTLENIPTNKKNRAIQKYILQQKTAQNISNTVKLYWIGSPRSFCLKSEQLLEFENYGLYKIQPKLTQLTKGQVLLNHFDAKAIKNAELFNLVVNNLSLKPTLVINLSLRKQEVVANFYQEISMNHVP
ncbi:MAG: prepilin-type N-terminal cleavage/methylation domain-containing protein [Pseudomonadota bacterium]